MGRNDVLLLDSLINKAKTQFSSDTSDSELFELYCFDQVLKDYELSFEELNAGWTDGTEDGGIDGFFVFVDEQLVTEKDCSFALRKSPTIQVELFTVKRSSSFTQEPLNALTASLSELLDLTKEPSSLAYPFRDSVVYQREILKYALVELADRRPRLIIRAYYCSRGSTSSLASNLNQRASLLRDTIRDLFGEIQVEVNFIGASELLDLSRRTRTHSLKLRFSENYITREGQNYVVLVPLAEYRAFVTDERGELRRYLFESNVRDFLGLSRVNQDIRATLERSTSFSVEDFWWLNNGVTILATHAQIIGRDIFIENVQIVNGLQTTESIYEYFNQNIVTGDARSVLVKILLIGDEQTRARIIKATNYQNPVEPSSLRGLDKIHYDIEQYLLDYGWYYDRRKNYYKNLGRPADKIVSMPYLASAVRAVALGNPIISSKGRRRLSLSDEAEYKRIFRSDFSLEIYRTSLEIVKTVQTHLKERPAFHNVDYLVTTHLISFIYTCDKLGGTVYRPDDIVSSAIPLPTEQVLDAIQLDLRGVAKDYFGKFNVGEFTQGFVEKFGRERYALAAAAAVLIREIKRAEDAESPRDRILLAYDVLRRTTRMIRSSAEGGRTDLRTLLRNAAMEAGAPAYLVDRTLESILEIRDEVYRNDDEVELGQAHEFIDSTKRLFRMMGVFKDS